MTRALNLLFLLLFLLPLSKTNEDEELELAKVFLANLESEVEPVCHQRALSEWNFATNLTEFNRQKASNSSMEYSKFWRRIWEGTKSFNWQEFKDLDIKRKFRQMSTLGVSILPDDQLQRYNTLKQSMERTYAKAKVCDFYNQSKCDLSLEPEIMDIFQNSRNPSELEYIWLQWRNVSGRVLKQNYTEFVSLIQIVAKMNNFPSATEYELRAYQTEELSINEFREQIEDLWQTLNPFYIELHAYVRYKLREFYGDEVFNGTTGTIPAHLLGNNWAQTWENVEDIVMPFNKKRNFNVTQRMNELNMTALDMAKMSEEFFVSLGLPKLSDLFWEKSVFEKPEDRDIICHASAWDLCNRQDFRIKQCTSISETDLLTLHHELGHIYYQMSYSQLPKVYRDGANPGFHEAIGDLIALSVQTPTHMELVGLIDHFEYDEENEINYLMRVALTKIAFLPYGYILDKWKWEGVFVNNTDSTLNCQWWMLREEYQGIGRPKNAPESEEFLDPASKYHIISNVPYIRYFISMILQFQLHESLCEEAENDKHLHLCDIYNSTRAGQKLEKLLSLGLSQPWPDALESVTGSRILTSKSMLKYFEPLYTWLKMENRRNNQTIGWETTTRCGSSNVNTNKALRHIILISVVVHLRTTLFKGIL